VFSGGDDVKTALVLSGGGARGSTHIGVIKALEEFGISVDMIVGVSIGAMVGTGYSILADSKLLEQRAKIAYIRSKKLKLNMSKMVSGDMSGWKVRMGCWYMNTVKGALPVDTYLRFFKKALNGLTFKDTKIELHMVATDIRSGETVVLSEGPLIRAMQASIAIPGIFPPVEIDGRLLVDGGTTNNLPVDIARNLGADRVIAVDLSSKKIMRPKPTANSYLIFMDRLRDILMHEDLVEDADLYLNPPVHDVDTLDFTRSMELIDIGYEYTKNVLEKTKGER
jgi:NTE family protein